MNCQGECKDCDFWTEYKRNPAWGTCGCGLIVDGGLYVHRTFGCNQFRERLGHTFVKLVETLYRTVDEEYDDVARKPRGVAFAILTLLDGSGEHWSGESRYRACVEENGSWKPINFLHHDLE